MDINLEAMEDLTGREDQVSQADPLSVSPSTDQVDLLLESGTSNVTSFSGFDKTSAGAREKVPQRKSKSASSSCKGNQHSKIRKYLKDSRSSKASGKISKGSSKTVAKPRASSSVETEPLSSQEPQPGPSSAPHVVPSPVVSPRSVIQEELAASMPALVSAVMQSLQPKLDVLDTKIQNLGHSEESLMPSVRSLPPYDEQNPWRSALRAPCQNDMITVEGLGTRPISDFEVFPPDGTFPYVYIRLNELASVREDKVPKETVLFPLNKAQGVLIQTLKGANCKNTKMLPFKGSLTVFMTLGELPNPFAT